MAVEVEARGGWQPVTNRPAQVQETAVLRLRGLDPAATVELGPVERRAAADGTLDVRLVDEGDLRCHIGLLPVRVGGHDIGEVDIVVDKISEAAFSRLRADLERTWLGLVRDDSAPTSLHAEPPDARPLWRQLLPIVEAIKAEPRCELAVVPGHARFERLRRPSQLRPSTFLASARGPVVPTDVLAERPVAADHDLVADTLRRLGALARRQSGCEAVARACSRQLAHPLFAHRSPVTAVSHGARHDQRYRRVLAIHAVLNRADTVITEGPGDLRAGVKSLDRLYEYWVFLKTVEGLAQRSGGLAEGQVGSIATRLSGRRLRLELPRGTTVRFTDGSEAAFEPLVSVNPRRSWHGLELVPHPNPRLAQEAVTPDVMIWLPEPPPNVVVIDAKYRGRHRIDAAAVDVHARYSRMRSAGVRAVREVVVAHPHLDLRISYPGYRAATFSPDQATKLPKSSERQHIRVVTDSPTSPADEPEQPLLGTGPSPVTVVADQYWMHQELGDHRIDLRELAVETIAGREPDRLLVIMPALPALARFSFAAVRRGWQVVDAPVDRPPQIRAIADAVEEAPSTVVVVTADPALLAELDRRGLSTERFDDLDSLTPLP